MTRSTLCKLSLAFAICCALICGISIAPLLVAVILALVALLCLLVCVLIYIVGGFVWLFTIGTANIFSYATSLSDFGLGLFNIVSPVAQFSFHYLTPIAGGIALLFGIIGIILSSVGKSRASLQAAEQETPSYEQDPYQYLDAEDEEPAYDTPYEDETEEAVQEEQGKKRKKKKQKTEKGAYIASLAVSIVFSILAAIAILVAVVAVKFFY